MGMEMWYLAVEDGGRLLERCRAEPEFGALLSLGSLGRDRWRTSRNPLDVEFLGLVDAMNRTHPGIDERIFTLDRSYDILHYLLAEGRQEGTTDATSLGTRAILGAASLPDHLRGGQGHRIRYSPPAAVATVAGGLARVTTEDLRTVYDPAAMEQQGVYKFWADRADDSTWTAIVERFEGLRSFYAAVAARSEGVIVLVT